MTPATEVAQIPPAHASETPQNAPQETLQEKATRIAIEEGFDPEIVKNVIDSETGRTWDCTLKGRAGELGCFQIMPDLHPVDPLDFEAAEKYFIQEYKKGNGYLWTSCNCYALVSTRIHGLPKMVDILPNTTLTVGAIAIFGYDGVKHIAVVESISDETFTVFEANYEPCKIGNRTISKHDPRLVGFYAP